MGVPTSHWWVWLRSLEVGVQTLSGSSFTTDTQFCGYGVKVSGRQRKNKAVKEGFWKKWNIIIVCRFCLWEKG